MTRSTTTALITDLGTVAAVGLAAVLATAALAKLRTPGATARAVVSFGLPDRLAPAVARLLPWAELAVAVALLAVPRVGAGAATALLMAFSVLIARVLARRPAEPVRCACFGAASTPVTAATLVRNGGLLAAAVVVGAASGPVRSVPSFAAVVTMTAATVIAAVAVQLTAVRATTGALWSTAAIRGAAR